MRAWFGPKFTGFGFSPRTGQGWLATAGLVAGLVYHRFFFRPEALTGHIGQSQPPEPA
jgi:hypothetical protein